MNNPQMPPGPPPAKGIIAQLQTMLQFRADILKVFTDLHCTYGDVVVVPIGSTHFYMLYHPDDIHDVLVKQPHNFHKDPDMKNTRQGLARFLGNGLLTSDGEFWKRQRKLAAPALHARRIQSYGSTMVDYTKRHILDWRDGQRLDLARETASITMKIIAKTMFDSDVSGDIDRVSSAMETVQSVAGQLPLLPPWVPTLTELRARSAKRELDDIILRIIRQWREKGEDKGDLLSMLLLAEDDDGQRMSDQQARDEAVTLFLAGHETTANALNWTFYLLAQHPDIEARLHDELDGVLGGQVPTMDDLPRLPYTEMVVKESMRIYPPAWVTGRQAIADTRVGGYEMPKGSVVNLLFYHVHHDPRWWPEPERFMPERFAPQNEALLNKHAYTPFGGGPRVCIGNAFAMMEARLLLATIAQRFRLTVQPGQRVEMNPLITLNPKGGLPMTVQQRRARPVVVQPVLDTLPVA